MRRNQESTEPRRCVSKGDVGECMRQENERGRKMGMPADVSFFLFSCRLHVYARRFGGAGWMRRNLESTEPRRCVSKGDVGECMGQENERGRKMGMPEDVSFFLFSCRLHVSARRFGGVCWMRRNQSLCCGLGSTQSFGNADDMTFACFDRFDAAKRHCSRIDCHFLLRHCGLCTSIDQYGGMASSVIHHQSIAAVS